MTQPNTPDTAQLDEQIVNIHHMRDTISGRQIAVLYGVSQSFVSLVLNGKLRRSAVIGGDENSREYEYGYNTGYADGRRSALKEFSTHEE